MRALRRLALLGVVATLTAATCQGAPTSATPRPSGESTGCSLRLIPGVGGDATLRGDGYRADVPVVLEIEAGQARITMTEETDAALRTDVRGAFVTVLAPGREHAGRFEMKATAGGCTAAVSGTVDPALFPAECITGTAVATGGPKADAYGALIAEAEPTAWWRFEEAEGETATADAGTDALLVGSPSLAQPGAMVGSRSIALDGSAWVDVDDLVLDGDFTIEAWLFLCGEAVDHRDGIVGQAGEGPDVNLAEGRLRLWDGTADPAVSDVPIDHGRWVHVAAVREGAALRLVQDGVVVGLGVHEPAFPVAAIGWGNAGRLEGRIDEVAIYERPLPIDRLAARVDAAR